jgi:hypothetical protein
MVRQAGLAISMARRGTAHFRPMLLLVAVLFTLFACGSGTQDSADGPSAKATQPGQTPTPAGGETPTKPSAEDRSKDSGGANSTEPPAGDRSKDSGGANSTEPPAGDRSKDSSGANSTEPPAGDGSKDSGGGNRRGGVGLWLVKWLVALGPNGPVGNHDVRRDAFTGLQAGDCAHVAEVGQYAEGQARHLYQGVGNACLAAFNDRTDLWQEAEAAFSSFRPRSFDFTCYDRAAYQVFATLVNLHRQDPTRQFKRASSGGVVQDGCVRMSKVQPSKGALEGGYPVTITGQNFPNPTAVVVGYSPGITVRVRPEAGGTRLTFTMPAGEYPGETYLTVQDEGTDTALPFTFESARSTGGSDRTAGGTGEPTGTPSDEASETPTDDPTTQATSNATG